MGEGHAQLGPAGETEARTAKMMFVILARTFLMSFFMAFLLFLGCPSELADHVSARDKAIRTPSSASETETQPGLSAPLPLIISRCWTLQTAFNGSSSWGPCLGKHGGCHSGGKAGLEEGHCRQASD